jgi:rRNA-processing protein FCF1
MKEHIRSLFAKYKQRGILIDTNILLLWFVGNVNPGRISQFNRTEKFLTQDYEFLINILTYFSKIVTTPNVLTEVNSLINQIGEPERSQCYSVFAQEITKLNESYIESTDAVQLDVFNKYGLTDCGIVAVARDEYLVLTDDFKLSGYLEKVGIDTVNFNHIRIYNW